MNTTQKINHPSFHPNELWQALQSIEPELCKALLPERLRVPKTPSTPEFAATQLGASVAIQEDYPNNLAACFASICAGRLIDSGVETYCVAPDLLRAAMHTDVGQIAWDDIEWPSRAFLFLLPQGVLQTPEDGSIGFLTVARNKAYEPLCFPSRSPWAARNDLIAVAGATTDGDMPVFGAGIARERFGELGAVIDAPSYNDEVVKTEAGVQIIETPPTVEDRNFTWSLLETGIVLALILQARPDLRSSGRTNAADRCHRGRLRSPPWIGADFHCAAPVGPSADHASVSHGHWERGTISANRSADRGSKLIWREPVRIL